MKFLAALALMALPAAPASAHALVLAHPARPAPAHPDYTSAANWLCRPGRADACAAPQDATIIRSNGSHDTETFKPASNPKFDCFYVYPTVSLDRTPNSDMLAGPEEREVAAFQAARFTQHCRVFAPVYRQVTLIALRASLTGKPVTADPALAYGDVKAAWDEYLQFDNHGRGVVLIGHSQGSTILKELLARSIEGTPVHRQIISVLIPGTNVAVPEGRDVGGDLKATPLCRSAAQFGCLVSYVSFRADAPPPPNSRFGVVPQPDMIAACVNPAELSGNEGVTEAYLGAKGAGLASAPMGPWSRDGAPVSTAFVKVPGLLSAACTATDKFHYLAVTINADPADARTDTIVGDVMVGGRVLPEWGLHLIDLNVAMGDLVELSDTQAKAWATARYGPSRKPAE